MRGYFKMPTLAYKKSPKTSKRTTFRAAVSARASKTSSNQYSSYEDFVDDEDDFLNEFFQSRKKKTDTFTASKKTQSLIFQLSDDEGRENRPKKVSFLKTQRNISPQNNSTVSESQDNEVSDSSVVINNDLTQTLESSAAETSAINSIVKLSASDATHMESTERLPPKPKPRQKTLGLISQTLQKPAEESVAQDVSRPHTASTSIHLSSDTSSNVAVASSSPHCLEGHYTGSQSLSRSSSSHSEPSQLVKKSTAVSGSRGDFVPHHSKEQETNHSASHEQWNEWLKKKKSKSKEIKQLKRKDKIQKEKLKKEQQAKEQNAVAFHDAWKQSKADYFKAKAKEKQEMIRKEKAATLEKEQKRKSAEQVFLMWKRERDDLEKKQYRKQLETKNKLEMKKQEQDEERRNNCKSVFSHWCAIKKNINQEQHTSQRNKKEEERCMEEDQMAQEIYESRLEWLEKKRLKSKEIMWLKQKEEMQKENRKKEQEAKEQDAVASYETWKKSKADYFKAKAKEKGEIIRKEKAANLEKEEKRKSAEQVFLKWKSEREDLLKKKHKKQLETENELKMKKQEQDEERRNNCESAFANWCELKKNVLQEQHTSQQKTLRNKMKEERYKKGERDQMAVEVYESWLAKKDVEKKRQREVQTILSDIQPHPRSLPNKNIPFRKY